MMQLCNGGSEVKTIEGELVVYLFTHTLITAF